MLNAAAAVETPWSSVGNLVFTRTYARRLTEAEDGPKETLAQTVSRIIHATDSQLNVGFTDDEKDRLRGYLLGFKGFVAGRFMAQLGTPTVDKLGLASLQNCAACVVDSPRAFTWAFDLLMLGSGVGYNIQRKYVETLPRIDEEFEPPVRDDLGVVEFNTPDTREGWVDLLGAVIDRAFSGGGSLRYSVRLVRPQGALIKGFGGVASGPEPLVRGLGNISEVLYSRRGLKLRPIDCLDIMNIIGQIVVSGNVRRSAQIAIGDYDDLEFLSAKRWDLGDYPTWRSNSNNSVVWDGKTPLPEEFWAGYEGRGEPYGLINLDLARKVGRTGEDWYPDPDIVGFNPCAEQGLANFETCALAELNLPAFESFNELVDASALLYRIVKHSLRLPCHLPETEAIVHKNMRMGIGITGYLQATEEQKSWLNALYSELRWTDIVYSGEKSWPRSIKLTTVKPSGTLSLLPGVTPGCHPGYAQHMIRRVRFAADSPLLDTIKAHGYTVENTDDPLTVVAEFPFSYPEGTALAKDVTAVAQLEVVRRLQAEWSDNAVSCTIYYRPEELEGIKLYLKENFTHNFKSLSFLLHSDHGFAQAPYEEITKERHDEIVQRTRLITGATLNDTTVAEIQTDCVGGFCPVT